MYKRSKMSRKTSRSSFKSGARRVHPKNRSRAVMRGGIRL